MNSVDSPSNTLPNNHKRHTVDVTSFKLNLHHGDDNDHISNSINNSHLLVTRETVLNGQTKTVEYVGDSSQNSSELPIREGSKFRKESLQVKIFKSGTVETCSPFLRKDLEDYKNEKENEKEDKIISPMIIIRENDEEEEKKNEGN